MKISCCYALPFLAASALADVVPAPLFTDHAVLQRGRPVPVWGSAAAGEKVSVSFAGHAVSTAAGPDGKWKVELPGMEADTTPQTLTIQGRNRIELKDILVGEVWIASGQSNMQFLMKDTDDAAVDIPASAVFSQIRHLKVDRKVSDVPVSTISGTWQAAGPDTTGDFTAVGYYFARDLQQELKVPVGIINCTWGGTRVEAWMPAKSLDDPKLSYVKTAWDKVIQEYPEAQARLDTEIADWKRKRDAAEAAGMTFKKRRPRDIWGPGHQATPSGLFNGMIAPMLSYPFRGVIWYQGEANASRPRQYGDLFPAMITGWRAEFDRGNFPFYWVQLPNYRATGRDKTEWAFIREGQARALALPNTGQAVAIDLGDGKNLHPTDKKPVGHRLALVALHRTYDVDVVDSGPVLEKCEKEGGGYRLTFGQTAGGLVAAGHSLTGFELAGEDREFHPADAVIEADDVIVSSEEVSAPVAVRYAWRNAPSASLFNREGLPAMPFRIDDW